MIKFFLLILFTASILIIIAALEDNLNNSGKVCAGRLMPNCGAEAEHLTCEICTVIRKFVMSEKALYQAHYIALEREGECSISLNIGVIL
jgi:hypothetical protein